VLKSTERERQKNERLKNNETRKNDYIDLQVFYIGFSFYGVIYRLSIDKAVTKALYTTRVYKKTLTASMSA
jgi:hypothetical protein